MCATKMWQATHLTSVVNESQPKIALKLMLLLFTKKDIGGVNWRAIAYFQESNHIRFQKPSTEFYRALLSNVVLF